MPSATTLKRKPPGYTLSMQYMVPNPLERELERGKRIISSRIGERRNLTRKVLHFWEPPSM